VLFMPGDPQLYCLKSSIFWQAADRYVVN